MWSDFFNIRCMLLIKFGLNLGWVFYLMVYIIYCILDMYLLFYVSYSLIFIMLILRYMIKLILKREDGVVVFMGEC